MLLSLVFGEEITYQILRGRVQKIFMVIFTVNKLIHLNFNNALKV